VRRVTVTEDAVARPDAFDLAEYWALSTARYEQAAPRTTVTVRIQRRAIGMLAELVGERAVREAVRLPEQEPGEWRTLRLMVDWPEEVPARLLALGGAVEVLDPPELRDRIVAVARGVLARHDAS
jgi:predicted DNA-binding transcriptional regulator YafY